MQAALSYNKIGDFYLQTHNLNAAEQALTKALRVGDDAELEAWDKTHGTDWTSSLPLLQALYLRCISLALPLIDVFSNFCGCQADAAVSHKYLVQLKEAQGYFMEAKKVRKRGARKRWLVATTRHDL